MTRIILRTLGNTLQKEQGTPRKLQPKVDFAIAEKRRQRESPTRQKSLAAARAKPFGGQPATRTGTSNP